MNQLLSIVDDALVVKKLSVQTLDGPVEATDDVRVQGNIFVDRDIKARRNIEVSGILTVDTLKVKNLIAENDATPAIDPNVDFTFVGKGEKQIDGKGLIWLDGATGSKQLVYKEGNRLWSTMNLDLARDRTFQINKIDVLSASELGPTVVTSNLQTVGELNGLKVSGQVEFDNWVFFNGYNNTMGLNTESPNATLGVVVENGIEVIVGAKDDKTAKIGTFSSNTLDLVTDNKTRMSLTDNGEVIFGSAKFKNAVVKIYGKLEVDELVTAGSSQDQPLIIFKSTPTKPVYQTGILWQHDGRTRHLVYAASPDRIYSSDIIDLAPEQWYGIDRAMVLSRTSLGDSVTESNLQKLGILRNLQVEGTTTLLGPVNIPNLNITSLRTSDDFSINIDGDDHLKINSTGDIVIGIEDHTNRNITLYGQTTLQGGLKINNQRIITGETAPAVGTWNKGDICYNSKPEMEGYVGWVCVQNGEPGRWCPFGLIMPVRG
jgi:hypothetical protein